MAHEFFKDGVAFIGRDTDSRGSSDGHRATRSKFHGVGKEIEQYLAKTNLVTANTGERPFECSVDEA